MPHSVSDGVMKYPVGLFAALLGTEMGAHAVPPQREPHIGDTYEITLTRDTSQKSIDGLSESSSHDQDAIDERVIGVRPDGIELEYDFSKETPQGDRDSSWQFPARVFRPFQGRLQLLDPKDVEKRVDAWLKAANWTRAVCGHWIFTWNAFRIDCDPDSVIKAVQAFEMDSDVRDGAFYHDSGARRPGLLVKNAGDPTGTKLSTKMEIDPDAVRRERAESDVVVGEITKKPVTLGVALSRHAEDVISGTIAVTFDVDAQGNVWRRTKITRLELKEPDGKSSVMTTTEILERHKL